MVKRRSDTGQVRKEDYDNDRLSSSGPGSMQRASDEELKRRKVVKARAPTRSSNAPNPFANVNLTTTSGAFQFPSAGATKNVTFGASKTIAFPTSPAFGATTVSDKTTTTPSAADKKQVQELMDHDNALIHAITTDSLGAVDLTNVFFKHAHYRVQKEFSYNNNKGVGCSSSSSNDKAAKEDVAGDSAKSQDKSDTSKSAPAVGFATPSPTTTETKASPLGKPGTTPFVFKPPAADTDKPKDAPAAPAPGAFFFGGGAPSAAAPASAAAKTSADGIFKFGSTTTATTEPAASTTPGTTFAFGGATPNTATAGSTTAASGFSFSPSGTVSTTSTASTAPTKNTSFAQPPAAAPAPAADTEEEQPKEDNTKDSKTEKNKDALTWNIHKFEGSNQTVQVFWSKKGEKENGNVLLRLHHGPIQLQQEKANPQVYRLVGRNKTGLALTVNIRIVKNLKITYEPPGAAASPRSTASGSTTSSTKKPLAVIYFNGINGTPCPRVPPAPKGDSREETVRQEELQKKWTEMAVIRIRAREDVAKQWHEKLETVVAELDALP